MVSLGHASPELQEMDSLCRATLDSYLAAIESMEAHPAEVEQELVAAHRRRLREIRTAISAGPDPQALENARIRLDEELGEFADGAASYLDDVEKETREILRLLEGAEGTLAEGSGPPIRELPGPSSLLRSLDLIHRRVGRSVTRLQALEALALQGHHAPAANLEPQLQLLRRRLGEAEALASTDPLTGLANRREAGRIMSGRIESRTAFSIMFFDLDGFKSVNDRYGHYVGDHVLRSFGARLEGQFRAGDVVCRWGGDEFLAVLGTGLEDPIARAGDVAARMCGLYAIQTPSGAVNVEVAASAGVAEHIPGETSEELFARADAFLYQLKRTGVAR